MLNTIVTGGTGFVGQWMRQMCPEDVTALWLSRFLYETNIIEHVYDIDYVVHLAPTDPRRAINLAKRTGARLLYCSSGVVYVGDIDTEYRKMKLDGEKMCMDSGIDCVIARLFTFFGDGLDENKAITQFFKSARAGEPIKVHGDGSCVSSYMHGAEMARQMWQILLKGQSRHAYDVGSTRTITMKRLAERVQTFTGAKIEYTSDIVPMPVYYPRGDNGIMD